MRYLTDNSAEFRDIARAANPLGVTVEAQLEAWRIFNMNYLEAGRIAADRSIPVETARLKLEQVRSSAQAALQRQLTPKAYEALMLTNVGRMVKNMPEFVRRRGPVPGKG